MRSLSLVLAVLEVVSVSLGAYIAKADGSSNTLACTAPFLWISGLCALISLTCAVRLRVPRVVAVAMVAGQWASVGAFIYALELWSGGADGSAMAWSVFLGPVLLVEFCLSVALLFFIFRRRTEPSMSGLTS